MRLGQELDPDCSQAEEQGFNDSFQGEKIKRRTAGAPELRLALAVERQGEMNAFMRKL